MKVFSLISKQYRLFFLLSLTICVTALGGFYYYIHIFYNRTIDIKNPVYITVTRGDSSHDIIKDLYSHNLIDKPFLFKLKLKQLGVEQKL